MEAALRKEGLPLFTLESRTPLGKMDVIGFTLQYEMSFTNILNMLDLAGLPCAPPTGKGAITPSLPAADPAPVTQSLWRPLSISL